MRIVIEVPPIDGLPEEEINDLNSKFNYLFQMSLQLIDNVAAVKLSPSVATKCEKARKKAKAAEAKAKKEEQDTRKAEE